LDEINEVDMMSILKKYGVYPDKFPEAENRFICWIDIMGIGNVMTNSNKVAANFMFRLHAIVLNNIYSNGLTNEMFMYPIMDGIYISSTNAESLEKCIVTVFQELSMLFVEVADEYSDTAYNYNFFVKAAISYGKINEGRNIKDVKALPFFEEHSDYVNRLVIGQPVINAYKCEKCASPFGIYIDEKAKMHFKEETFSNGNNKDFLWWKSEYYDFDTDKHKKLYMCILDYYEFYIDLFSKCRSKYSNEEILKHLRRVKDYFLFDTDEYDSDGRTQLILNKLNKH